MTVRVAINGFGRTGGFFLRVAIAPSHRFEIVAINDLGSPVALAQLLARDSVHGRFPEPVHVVEYPGAATTRRTAVVPQELGRSR